MNLYWIVFLFLYTMHSMIAWTTTRFSRLPGGERSTTPGAYQNVMGNACNHNIWHGYGDGTKETWRSLYEKGVDGQFSV